MNQCRLDIKARKEWVMKDTYGEVTTIQDTLEELENTDDCPTVVPMQLEDGKGRTLEEVNATWRAMKRRRTALTQATESTSALSGGTGPSEAESWQIYLRQEKGREEAEHACGTADSQTVPKDTISDELRRLSVNIKTDEDRQGKSLQGGDQGPSSKPPPFPRPAVAPAAEAVTPMIQPPR